MKKKHPLSMVRAFALLFSLVLVGVVLAMKVAYAATTITTQPKSVRVSVGSTATFSVVASGSGKLSYQWQAKNPSTGKWVNSTADTAKTSKLSIKTQVGHNGFQFRCIVTDASGSSKTSSAATLTVRPKFTTQPQNQSAEVGTTVTFTAVATGKTKLKYQWQAMNPSTGKWVNSTAASAKTTQLSIKTQVGHNGFQFRCIVTDGNGVTMTSKTVTLTIKPHFMTQPKSVSVNSGSAATFTVAATGQKKLTYQWQYCKPNSTKWVNSTNASAKKTTFTINTSSVHNGFKIRCVVTDGNGHRTASKAVTLTVKGGSSVAINSTTFPDNVFRNYVSQNFDKDKNGSLSDAECAAVKKISVSGMGIYNLKGIEYFTQLEELDCGSYRGADEYWRENYISSLDLSKNKMIKEVSCSYGGLESINLSGCTKLESFWAYACEFTTLNISSCTNLKEMNVEKNWDLATLDIRNNKLLEELYYEHAYTRLIRDGDGVKEGGDNHYGRLNEYLGMTVANVDKKVFSDQPYKYEYWSRNYEDGTTGGMYYDYDVSFNFSDSTSTLSTSCKVYMIMVQRGINEAATNKNLGNGMHSGMTYTQLKSVCSGLSSYQESMLTGMIEASVVVNNTLYVFAWEPDMNPKNVAPTFMTISKC